MNVIDEIVVRGEGKLEDVGLEDAFSLVIIQAGEDKKVVALPKKVSMDENDFKASYSKKNDTFKIKLKVA